MSFADSVTSADRCRAYAEEAKRTGQPHMGLDAKGWEGRAAVIEDCSGINPQRARSNSGGE